MILILSAAVVSDLMSYRVKNQIIFFGWGIGILGIWWNKGLVNPLWGAGLPILIMWPLFRFRMLGAGDIKLFSVIGSIYGSHFVLRTIIAAFFFGAVISIIQIAYYGNLVIRLHYLVTFMKKYVKKRQVEPYYCMERDGKEAAIHFTLAIFCGFLFCLFKTNGV